MLFVACPEQGISALQVQRGAGPGSDRTAWMLLHKVRSRLAHKPLCLLEGAVELDETSIGGYRPGRNGRGVGKTGVAIGVERREETAGSMRFIQIPDTTGAVLNAFVEDSIRPEETSVFSDAWGSYEAPAELGIDHRPRRAGHDRQALGLLPWAYSGLRQPQELAPRHVPRRQPESPCSATSIRSATPSTAAGARASSPQRESDLATLYTFLAAINPS